MHRWQLRCCFAGIGGWRRDRAPAPVHTLLLRSSCSYSRRCVRAAARVLQPRPGPSHAHPVARSRPTRAAAARTRRRKRCPHRRGAAATGVARRPRVPAAACTAAGARAALSQPSAITWGVPAFWRAFRRSGRAFDTRQLMRTLCAAQRCRTTCCAATGSTVPSRAITRRPVRSPLPRDPARCTAPRAPRAAALGRRRECERHTRASGAFGQAGCLRAPQP